jgi:hypothetical protein
VGAEVADQRHLGLGPDPAANPVAPHQHHEAGAAVHRLLQAQEPLIALTDALVVLEHREPALFQLSTQTGRRLQVVAAVAQKDLVVVRHKQTLRRNASNSSNRLKG